MRLLSGQEAAEEWGESDGSGAMGHYGDTYNVHRKVDNQLAFTTLLFSPELAMPASYAQLALEGRWTRGYLLPA